MRKATILIIATLVISGGFFYSQRSHIRDLAFKYQKAKLPDAVYFQELAEGTAEGQGGEIDKNTSAGPEKIEFVPEEINLAVPFTPQAPHANWDLPYKETCEEASLLMVARYKNGEAINSPEDADREILKLVEWQNNYFGDYKDTTARQTAEIAREYYGFENTEVIYDFTIDDIKKALVAGHPVIVPAAGRELPNPYFRRPGPLYHMLVIRGYTKDKFITNDPGTKRGEEFVYKYDDLLNAVHDWNGGGVESGQKTMIVVR